MSSLEESAVSSYSLAGGLDLFAFGALFFAAGFAACFGVASAPVSSAAELADIA